MGFLNNSISHEQLTVKKKSREKNSALRNQRVLCGDPDVYSPLQDTLGKPRPIRTLSRVTECSRIQTADMIHS